jgi:hypothetical protein
LLILKFKLLLIDKINEAFNLYINASILSKVKNNLFFEIDEKNKLKFEFFINIKVI